MLAQATSDLFGYLTGIPALAQTTGLAVGGALPDPGDALVKLPAAWILFAGEETLEDERVGQPSVLGNGVLTFWVMLYIPYKGQADLLATQLPLLEAVKQAIHGQTASTGKRWQFQASHLVLINTDRMGYRLIFSVDSI